MNNNSEGRYIVALEIGSSKIRGAVGLATPGGAVDVIAVTEEKLIDKVRYGIIQNMEVCNTVSRVLTTLENHPQIEPRKITGVYVGLGGRTLWSTTADVNTDLGQEDEILEPIINDLCRQAESTVSSDRDAVDVLPVRFTVDNKIQNHPIGAFGRTVGARMTVLSCAPQLKKMLRRVIEERLNLRIIDYVPRVLAEAELVLSDEERRLGCLFIDFGAETTSLAIFRNGTPVFVTTLPMGSRNITLDLTSVKRLEERAEEIKKTIGNAQLPDNNGRNQYPADGIDYTEINNYIHARAEEIIANIIAQVEYSGLKLENLGGDIVIVGGGSALRGFNDLLSNQTNLKVRVGTIPAQIRFTDASLSAAGAIDVISILADAAKLDPEECLSELPQEEPEEEPTATQPVNYETQYATEGETGEVRIGRMDDDEEEERPKRPAKKSMFSGLFRKMAERITSLADDPEDNDDE